MAELFTVENLFTLGMLVFLQAVLGFDNLLYISLESKRVDPKDQARVRKWGIGLAIILRIALLFIVVEATKAFQIPFFDVLIEGVFQIDMNVHSLIVLLGGGFIIYTAVKEIIHMLSIDDLSRPGEQKERRSAMQAMALIVVMNLVFSFDSILSAIALTDVFLVMATAIIISGVLMMVMADTVADFLQKNRKYEILGLFILFLVGVMLVSEGGHLAHISLMGHHVEPMAKSTFYFVLIVLVIVDIAQGRYQKKLAIERQAAREPAGTS